jgi:hypothetical protein
MGSGGWWGTRGDNGLGFGLGLVFRFDFIRSNFSVGFDFRDNFKSVIFLCCEEAGSFLFTHSHQVFIHGAELVHIHDKKKRVNRR